MRSDHLEAGGSAMSMARVTAAVIAAVLILVSSSVVESASPVPSPPASAMPAPTSAVDVTVRTGGEPCRWELGCLAGITLSPLGSGMPALEGTIDPTADPSSPDGSLEATLAPGTYVASVTVLGVAEVAPEGESPETATTTVMGGCARTIELDAERPDVELTAAMAWDQPACGIAIEPAGRAAPRPEIAQRIREPKRTPRFTPRGAPTVSTKKNGIKLELWVKDETLRPGQWLVAHLRVSNVGGRTIRHNGKFEDLDCPPISSRADTSDLFDPGRTWSGVAATYKKRIFRDGLLTRTGFSIPRYARGNGCGDVGQAGRLRPGDVEDIPLAGMPRYWLRDQPLPPGTIHLTVGFDGNRRQERVSVSTDVELAGDPVEYASPGELVDAALSTPGFVETLERQPDPRDWANAHVSSWMKKPYPPQPRLEGARGAPAGIIEVTQFFGGSERGAPFVVEAVIDPWTAESYGATAWPGWVTPAPGSVQAGSSRTPSAGIAPMLGSDPRRELDRLVQELIDVLTSLAALLWPDAPVPASLAEYLPAAREQLWNQATDGLRLPLHLRFLEARCSSDGGVALVFEEIGRPFFLTTYAYTVRGSMPTSADDGWGNGGTGLRAVLDDSEFIHLMGDDTVVCP